MRRLLILDTETTGTNPETDQAIEVAAILYSIEHATVLACFSSLIRAPGNPCEAINHIPPAALAAAPEAPGVWKRLAGAVEQAEAIVAHQASFDRSFVPPWVTGGRPWVCSRNDIRWPRQNHPGSSLVNLALEHGLGVATAHRAMADCELLARLFNRCHELGADLGAMMVHAMRPKATFAALVPIERKDEAKAAGFAWIAERRQWLRTMAIDDVAELPFPTNRVEG